MSEEWRPVYGYESHYEVSSVGRVRRVLACKGATPGRILRDRKQGEYRAVQLCKGDIKKKIGAHVLVTEAFYGPRPDGMVPNHKDLDKHNNRADNLEWVTHRGNCLHAIANGAKPGRPMPGEQNPRAKLTWMQVEEIRQLKGRATQRIIANRYGVSRSAIQFIHQGKHWKLTTPADLRVREFPRISTP